MRVVILQSQSNDKKYLYHKELSKKINDISSDMTKEQTRISRDSLWNQHILFKIQIFQFALLKH
jgi:hypothetical protein